MLSYYCKNCKIESNYSECPICWERTEIKSKLYWCKECNVPMYEEECPICNKKGKYIGTDIRPVFPEERLLLEILIDEPFKFKNSSVWNVSGNKYIVDGVKLKYTQKELMKKSPEDVIRELEKYTTTNSYEVFNKYIDKFIKLNTERYNSIVSEATSYIIEEKEKYGDDQTFVSFSGGKDSTVVSSLVVRALGTSNIIHIFGDTTLEFPTTYEYVKRFKNKNIKTPVLAAKNKEKNFYDMCEVIGPPSRVMRWCCIVFKTGAITKKINTIFKNKDKILTFYGIRRSESLSRSKYERTSDSPKITKQRVASPILDWNDFDVWLYLLSSGTDFNDAYRLGYSRVGCWCCPNNTTWAQYLSKIYMPSQSERWRNILLDFAKRVGKPDPEVYVDEGKWKARQGGNGLAAAEDVKIKFTNCTAEEHAKIYKLNKPLTDDFYNLFIPFGKVSRELGRKLLHEVLVLDMATNVPILSIQPFSQDDYNYAVKIRTLNVAKHEDLQRMVAYQIRKYNACKRCLKCESVCSFDAISVSNLRYNIDENKCRRCKKCITAKYLEGGCLMDRFLRSKEEK